MKFNWIHESPARWDADKARIIGGAEAGIFDMRMNRQADGNLVPGDWWRVEKDGRVVGYGWMDLVWGNAEVNVVTDSECRGEGVGTFILERLADEAKREGVHYLYNIVRPTHPRREEVASWLDGRGYEAGEDGSMFHVTVPSRSKS